MRAVPTIMIAACATAAPVQRRVHDREPVAVSAPAVTEPEATPWFRTWNATAERERLALAGATDASGLEAEYAHVCGPSWPPTVTGSPLLRYRTGGTSTRTGVIVYLSPLAGAGDAVLADIRCHFVGMLLAPFGVDDSPFDLPGLHIDARGDETGIAMELTVGDPTLTFELQRRVNRQVEETNRQHHEE